MTSVLAYLLAVLLVPVALSLMLFVMARMERDLTSQAIPYVPVGGSTPLATDGETSRVNTNAPNAA